jgi:hypothetical protein
VKVLFCALHFGYFRNFESVVVSLAERGHQVHLAADEPDVLGGQALVDRLAAEHPGVTFGTAPAIDNQPWFRLARKLRIGADWVRFHDEPFTSFRKTRQNLTNLVPRAIRRLVEAPVGRTGRGRRAALALLRAGEALMPVSGASTAFIEAHDPDVVLLASASVWRAPQFDHLRAARALGRRTGICVFSWDSLSTKAFMRIAADRVFVWNETQAREAIDWHRLPADRVVTTGAQCYDQWFDRRPSRDRATFCRRVGLDPAHPVLLYVCSVMSPDPRESRFVRRWIEEIRRSPDPRLRDAGILVRPHPERLQEWQDVPLDGFHNVALHGRNPITPEAQTDYFDSLFHSHAVAGVATSAFVEAAIVGRPVHTVLLPEFEIHQSTQHFRYLLEVGGGVLKTTRSMPEHLAELAAALERPAGRDEQNVRFVRAFVRPQGLEAPATPAFVAAVEQLAAAAPLPADVPGRWHGSAQPLVHLWARSADRGWLRPAFRDTLELQTDVIEAGRAASKQAAAAEKAARLAEKQQRLAEHRRRRRHEQIAAARRNWRKHVARLKGHLKDVMGEQP